MFLFCLVFAMFCARLFICALWSPAGKGLTSWLSFVVSSVSLSLSHWYPGSGVVLDCIDSWSLHHYLLLKQKLLRIVIDENLAWTPQIDNLCSILSTKISLIKHISAYVPQNVRKMFYQAYILLILDYGSNTWDSTSGSNIERLSKLQNVLHILF